MSSVFIFLGQHENVPPQPCESYILMVQFYISKIEDLQGEENPERNQINELPDLKKNQCTIHK